MGPDYGADGIQLGYRIGQIGFKGAVDRLLEGLAAMGHRYHVGTENAHPHHVRMLLGNIHLAHVDVTLEAYQGRGGGQRHPMLTGAGLGNHLLLAHFLASSASPRQWLIL